MQTIRLEPLGLDHIDGYVALLSDAATAAYISEEGPLTRDAAIAKLQHIALRNTAGATQAYFAVINGTSRDFLGYIAAHDRHAKSCPISYAILPNHRQRGVAKAAIRLLLGYLSHHSTAEWIEAKTHPENAASKAALQACGFIHFAPACHQTEQRDIFRRKNNHPAE